MNKQIVLDSNVFNKLFLAEDDRKQAIDLVLELGNKDYRIISPNLFLYEVLSVAAVSNFSTEAAYQLIYQHQKVNLELVDINKEVISQAIAITEKGHPNSGYPSFYDSAYHALAIQYKCQFVTADRRHKVKADQFGYITLLNDWESLFI